MEVKNNKKIIGKLSLGLYTMGFICGSIAVILSETPREFQLDYSFYSLLAIVMIMPVIYASYRFLGKDFDNLGLIVKLLLTVVMIIGIFMGGLFMTIGFAVGDS